MNLIERILLSLFLALLCLFMIGTSYVVFIKHGNDLSLMIIGYFNMVMFGVTLIYGVYHMFDDMLPINREHKS